MYPYRGVFPSVVDHALPPSFTVAGKISWARYLLKRVSEPMQEFETESSLMAHRVCCCSTVIGIVSRHFTVVSPQDAQKIIKTYNKLAKRLVEFECVWSLAWVESIQSTTLASLNAPLLVRNVQDGRLYVNFDHELWQLIREAKCLDRLGGVFIPDAVRVLMLQEEKLKDYYHEVSKMLKEYADIVSLVIPVTAELVKPLLADLEFKFRPGTLLLTWSSITIDHFKTTVWETLEVRRDRCFSSISLS